MQKFVIMPPLGHLLAAHGALIPFLIAAVAGCDIATDAATRLAYDIEATVERMGSEEGARSTLRHVTPSKSGECSGSYKVQLDQVGALIIWCKDAAGQTVSSHSTTYHARFVDTPQTHLLDNPAGEALTLELERRGGRVVIVDAR